MDFFWFRDEALRDLFDVTVNENFGSAQIFVVRVSRRGGALVMKSNKKKTRARFENRKRSFILLRTKSARVKMAALKVSTTFAHSLRPPSVATKPNRGYMRLVPCPWFPIGASGSCPFALRANAMNAWRKTTSCAASPDNRNRCSRLRSCSNFLCLFLPRLNEKFRREARADDGVAVVFCNASPFHDSRRFGKRSGLAASLLRVRGSRPPHH